VADIAIRAERLTKRYEIAATAKGPHRLHGRVGRYRTLRETIVDSWASAVGYGRRSAASTQVLIALDDVSFEIKQGETVGIIGYNGAGKTTLLKILARITSPSSGRAEVHGRLGSLLEVGTGFHHELTGRENLYLNGAILGMKRSEIARKFDEIVGFAEIEDFIDTPVKHYSSGMYMRLAFAVAAYLEPDILVIDEVLAVGDARFQKKCLAKMQEVGEQGRTVLFVSHNMQAVSRLCDRALLLERGKLVKDGPAAELITAYLREGTGTAALRQWANPETAPSRGISRLCAVRIRGADGSVADTIDIREPIDVEVEYEVIQPGHVLVTHLKFYNENGIEAFAVFDTDPAWRRRDRPTGRYVSAVKIPGNFMAEGMLFVTVGQFAIDPVRKQFYIRDVVSFHVVDSLDGDSARGDYAGEINAVVRPLMSWSTRIVPA
jgi:lipopolysaccharide transport system ATP-binding protein